MYLSRAEDLIDFWNEEDGGAATGPMTPQAIAAQFGGRVRGRHG